NNGPFMRSSIPTALFSPDSKLLAVNVGEGQQRIELYEVPSGKRLRTLNAVPVAQPAPAGAPGAGGFQGGKGKGPGGAPGAYQPGGGGKGGGKKGKGVGPGVAFGFGALHMLFSPDSKALAFQVDSGATINVFETATGRQLGAMASPLAGNRAAPVAFSP